MILSMVPIFRKPASGWENRAYEPPTAGGCRDPSSMVNGAVRGTRLPLRATNYVMVIVQFRHHEVPHLDAARASTGVHGQAHRPAHQATTV